MKKYVIISSNGNPDYEWYIPLVTWAWAKFGWEVVVMRPMPLSPFREETVTQCIRLYAALLPQFNDGDMLMTSDADMIPLSNYWHPNPKDITVYGHDLTGYKHTPICYIAMTVSKWKSVMNMTHPKDIIEDCMRGDLRESNALSEIKDEWWVVDQDIITERLSKFTLLQVHRGIEPGSHLPLGRMDRAGMKMPSTLIDFHAPRDPKNNIEAIREVIIKAFGECPEL